MIEFKAECGHTVRARDEDSGGVVRCSYCGRDAAVPDEAGSDLDYLLREIEETGEKDKRYRRPKKKGERKRWFKDIRRDAFDPFSLALKMCYLAVLVIIVYVVAQKAVIPLVKGTKPLQLFGHKTEAVPADGSNEIKRRGQGDRRSAGLIGNTQIAGLYVSSIPSGASAYVLETSRAPTTGRIANQPGVRQLQTDGAVSHLQDGEYFVEVSLPWHDKRLGSYQDYWELRRAIEKATDSERRRLLEEYFIPDDAVDVFVHEAQEQIYLVRQYRATVQRDRSRGVQAIFLPRTARANGPGFAIEPIVTSYAPSERRYAFDEELVSNELAYYGVQVNDRTLVVEALYRMGVISYVVPDGSTRLFRIGIDDGVFATRIVREPER